MAGMGRLHFIDNDQSSELCGQLLGEVLCPVQQFHRARDQVGQLIVGRLQVAVKEQNVSGHLCHDMRRQHHQSRGQCRLAGTASK